MAAGFFVHGQVIRLRRQEHVEEVLAGFDHQMRVKHGVRIAAAQRLHERGAVGKVGHEVPVHHVDVQPVEIAVQRIDRRADRKRVGGKQRRGDEHGFYL